MYRILSASKDAYITNKYVAGSRSLNSNVGQAGTIDLYSLYDETNLTSVTSSIREVSRGLIQFDYSELQSLISSSLLDITSSTFQCFVSMKDCYGGQTTPSNFQLVLFPVSKSWDEGRGMDVVAYRDQDAVNFSTASMSTGSPILWVSGGVDASGSLGNTNIDIIISGNLGAGSVGLGKYQLFERGDEDLLIDVTSIVSATLKNILPNYGFRLSYTLTEELAESTYFVKRFGTRHTNDKALRPKLIVKYNDSISDKSGMPLFNTSQSLFLYNYNPSTGELANIISGTTTVNGSNSLMFELAASKSVSYLTTSWSVTHSASVTYTTKSLSYFSESFTGSQYQTISGVYSVPVYLNSIVGTLNTWLSGSSQQKFKGTWKSLDGNIQYGTQYFEFKTSYGSFSNVPNESNYVINLTNLKNVYKQTDGSVKIRIFAQDYNTEQVATRVPTEVKSVILPNILWGIKQAFTKKEIIPFDEVGTKVSTDAEGMYFTIYTNDLDINEVYQIDLLINDNYFVENNGFRFKVVQ
jgi:hypothetical protein